MIGDGIVSASFISGESDAVSKRRSPVEANVVSVRDKWHDDSQKRTLDALSGTWQKSLYGVLYDTCNGVTRGTSSSRPRD